MFVIHLFMFLELFRDPSFRCAEKVFEELVHIVSEMEAAEVRKTNKQT